MRLGSSTSATLREAPFANCTRRIVALLFDDVESLERLFVDGEAEAGEVVVEVDGTVLRHRLSVEDVPEELVAYLDVDLGEELGNRRVEAGHDDVVVVHLAGVRRDGHLKGLS